jgi:hypothetical protein
MLADAIADQLTEAEIALLNFDSKDTCRLTRKGAVRLPGARLLALPIDVNQPVSAAGYVITRKACERMTKLLPVRAKVDDWAYRYNEGMLDRVRCVVPLAITKSPSSDLQSNATRQEALSPMCSRCLRATTQASSAG